MTDYKHKINAEGEYLPFYGYTSVSMLSSKTSSVLQNIEQLISQTIIGKYYSPLPHTTYHMTLFNIYCMASSPIPPVQRWTLENKENKIPEKLWLPEDVLKIKHIKALDCLRKLPSHLKITNLEFYYKKGLGVWVTLDEESVNAVTNLRKEFSKIYEHDDANLKLHITFAYLFKELPFKNGTREDKKALKTELLKLVERSKHTLKLCTLTNHNIIYTIL